MNTYEYTYKSVYNRIVAHGGKILEARTNHFIVWDNPEGTVRRADYFDADGIYEGRQVIFHRPKN